MSGFAVEETAPEWVPLIQVAGCVLAVGFCYAARGFIEGTLGEAGSAVGWIPVVGKWAKAPIHKVEQKLVAAMNGVIDGLDNRISAWWHQWAQTYESIGHEIYGLAVSDARFYYAVFHRYALPVLAPRLHYAEQRAATARAQAEAAHAKAQAAAQAASRTSRYTLPHAINARTRPLQREWQGIEADVRTFERWATREIDVAIPADIAGIRARTRGVEDDLAGLWRRVKGLDKARVGAAFAAAVAVAGARLGLGWLRCGNVGKMGRGLCRMDSQLLDALLLGGVAIFGPLSIVKFGEELLTVEDEIIGFVKAGFVELRDF